MSWDPTTTSGAAVVVVTGLVIDGKTDNHATITAAMAAVAASPSGKGLVLLPQGAIATSALTIPTGVTLRGCGHWRIKNPGTTAPAPSSVFGTMLCPATGATYARALVTMATNSRVYTLSICGDPLSGTAGTGAPVALLASGTGVTIDQSVCVYGGSAVCVDSTPTAQDFHMNARTFQFSHAGTQSIALGIVTSATAVATGVTTVVVKGQVNLSLMVKGAAVVNFTTPTALGVGPYLKTAPVTTGANTKLVIANAKTAPAATAQLLCYQRLGIRTAGSDARIGVGVRIAGGGAIMSGADIHSGAGFHVTHQEVSFTPTVVGTLAGTSATLSSVEGIVVGSSVGIVTTPVTGGAVGAWSAATTYKATAVVVRRGNFYVSKQNSNTNHAVTTATWWGLIMSNKVWVTAVNQTTGVVTLSQTVTRASGKTLSFSASVNITTFATLIMPDVTLDGFGMAHIFHLSGACQVGTWNIDGGGTTGHGRAAAVLHRGVAGGPKQGVSIHDFTVQAGIKYPLGCLGRWIVNTSPKLRWYSAFLTATAIPHTTTVALLWTNGRPLFQGEIYYNGVLQVGSTTRLPVVHVVGPYALTTTTFGSTAKMAGIGATFTPTTTGCVLVTVTGFANTQTAAATVKLAGRWAYTATHTVPAKGAAVVGTFFPQTPSAGTAVSLKGNGVASNGNSAFTLTLKLTVPTAKLTTQLWVDVTLKSTTTADKARLNHVMVTFQEVGAVV